MGGPIWLPSDKVKGVNKHVLIYFVCGNPGLVEYYTDFLTCLRGLLSRSEVETAYDIYGRNLFGFSDDEHEPFSKTNGPWDLERQIEGIYEDVAARRVGGGSDSDNNNDDQESTTTTGQAYDGVMLMGHSVGAYIAVEAIHRHMQDPTRAPELRLRHGLLLFPTVTHIAASPSGARLTMARRFVPFMDRAAPGAAAAALMLLPRTALVWVARRLLGFTPRCAEVTARWLKSRDGVRQALHLGFSEMETICEERWDEELWWMGEKGGEGESGSESESEERAPPRFYMFFGRNDEWVANHFRDEFIAKRRGAAQKGRGGPKIEVDEGDIPHAFCTRQDTSWAIAKKVHEWVEESEGKKSAGDESTST